MGMGFWWVIGIVVLIAFIWLLVRAASGSSAAGRDPAERILRERYARGEIDKDEFDRRLADLRR